MKKIIKTAIALTAIVVTIRAICRNIKKDDAVDFEIFLELISNQIQRSNLPL